jgi:hypothetical protein
MEKIINRVDETMKHLILNEANSHHSFGVKGQRKVENIKYPYFKPGVMQTI